MLANRKRRAGLLKIMKQSETGSEKFGDWPYHLRQERGQNTHTRDL